MPSTPAETTSQPTPAGTDYRKLYIALFAVGFLLRIVCMLWWKSYIG